MPLLPPLGLLLPLRFGGNPWMDPRRCLPLKSGRFFFGVDEPELAAGEIFPNEPDLTTGEGFAGLFPNALKRRARFLPGMGEPFTGEDELLLSCPAVNEPVTEFGLGFAGMLGNERGELSGRVDNGSERV